MLWLWGLAGAFIYAGPRWIIALSGKADSRSAITISTMEMLVALAVGTLAAGAFGPLGSKVLLTTLKVQDENAMATVIGLFANRLAPELVERGSSAFNGGVGVLDKVLKALKGDEKK
jgi:hypothetical protein